MAVSVKEHELDSLRRFLIDSTGSLRIESTDAEFNVGVNMKDRLVELLQYDLARVWLEKQKQESQSSWPLPF